MIKICHIISAFQRHDTRIFWKQCLSLVNSGYQVILLTNDNGVSEVKEGVNIVTSGFRYSNRLQRICSSPNAIFLKAIEINADIYQFHDPELIPVAVRIKKRGKKVIYDSHEDFPRQLLEKEWIPKFLRKIVSVLAEFYLRMALNKLDAIITVTPHIASSLSKASKSIHVITNYPLIENNFIPFSLEEYSQRGNRLCYAGTVYRSSLQENILKAISEEESISYLLVGIIDEKYKTDLAKFSVFKKVEIASYVPRDVLPEFYSKASIGMAIFDYSPNLGYRMGSLGVNKIFEYMYFGLPVICTDFKLWKELNDKYKFGITVNPNNIEDIRIAIRFLNENKSEAYQMGQNGRKAVLEELNWDKQRDLYLEIIRKTYSAFPISSDDR